MKRWTIEPDGTGYYSIEDGPTEVVEVVPACEVDRMSVIARTWIVRRKHDGQLNAVEGDPPSDALMHSEHHRAGCAATGVIYAEDAGR